MESFRSYILSVTAAALILGIVSSIVDPKSSAGGLVKLIGGLYLTFVVIQPLANFDFDAVDDFWLAFSVDGRAVSTAGENLAKDAMADIIKAETEAYILDKAGLYRAEISADVTLSDDDIPVPVSVTIRGNISPYAKAQLQSAIETELDIPKENQVWIGTP